MNIEELKLVLETIRGISGDAGTAAIWWIALHYGSEILTGLFVVFTLVSIVYMVVRSIASSGEWKKLGEQLCEAYGEEGNRIYITDEQRAVFKKAIEGAKNHD